MISYLANCNGECTDVDKTALMFNKIDEAGLIDGSVAPGRWASDAMIANNNTWVTTIPSTIAPGKYVLRHETIALHSAGEVGGAQNYAQCVNLEVTGSGTDSLSAGTLGTALYTADDAGLVYNIYQANTEYPIPGPALIAAARGSGSDSAPSATASISASVTGAFDNSTISAAPTTFLTATRIATSSVDITFNASTNIAAVSSTPAAGSITASATASPTSSGFTTTMPGSSGTPKRFVCYEVEE
ncbi:hypothetical protein LTR24_007912 [Lithohypha guttulata]|uniref:Auxiliary Activity family 9 catalytic domain-containing protein n=1 Tax=Lithohypha guttulata TaxID=1690604 RepID=A0ABR0K210_9EURO|nr:hypothetical protein LTR24_007912 [Lithohypha guttulata]